MTTPANASDTYKGQIRDISETAEERTETRGPSTEYSKQCTTVTEGTLSHVGLIENISVDMPASGFEGTADQKIVNRSAAIDTGSTLITNIKGFNYEVAPASGNTNVLSQISIFRIGIDETAFASDDLNISIGVEVDLPWVGVNTEPVTVTGFKITNTCKNASENTFVGLDIALNNTNAIGAAAQNTCAIKLIAPSSSSTLATARAGMLCWGGAHQANRVRMGAFDANSIESLWIGGSEVWTTDNGGSVPTLRNLPTGATAAQAKWLRLYDEAGNLHLVPAWAA